MAVVTTTSTNDTAKAPQDGHYWIGNNRFRVKAGDPIPAGARLDITTAPATEAADAPSPEPEARPETDAKATKEPDVKPRADAEAKAKGPAPENGAKGAAPENRSA